MTIRYYIDDDPVTYREYVAAQIRNDLLFGNTYEHRATMANGDHVVRALSPTRVTVRHDGSFHVSSV